MDETQSDPTNPGTVDATGQQQNGGEPPEPKFSQADVDRIVEERLKREKAKAEEKTRKAREEVEAKALADQQQWQELAEKRAASISQIEADLAARVGELETAQQRATRLEQALQAQLVTAKEGLPDAVVELVDRLDPVDQLEYLAKHKASLGGSKAGGVPPSPKPADANAVSTEQKQTSAKRLGAQIRNWM